MNRRNQRYFWFYCYNFFTNIYLFFFSMNTRRSGKFYSCKSFGYACSYSTRMIFLIAYAILRSIPNKLGGVIALVMSILILIICPFIYKSKFRGYIFYPINKLLF